MKTVIRVDHFLKDYGNGRGVFDASFEVMQGETFGFVGINGAGKTTTLRSIMGFIRPDGGSASVNGLDCWRDSAKIKKTVGYIPGEIAFPDSPTGTAFLKRQADLMRLTDMSYAEHMISKLQLDPTANLKRMSKGMKQKTAIVAALMCDPDILILDEPTTGLDPLMRASFVELLEEEKKKGKTILMSSHMFDEVEDTCDRVALIKDGRISSIVSVEEIKHHKDKTYKIEFHTKESYGSFITSKIELKRLKPELHQVIVKVCDGDINSFFKLLKNYDVKFLSEIKHTLDNYFKKQYKGESDDESSII